MLSRDREASRNRYTAPELDIRCRKPSTSRPAPVRPTAQRSTGRGLAARRTAWWPDL